MLYDKFGVTLCDTERATPGYTLFSPLWQSMTYIINMEGEIVHQWNWKGRANAYGRLLPEGDLLWGEAHDADYKGHVKNCEGILSIFHLNYYLDFKLNSGLMLIIFY